MSVQSPVSMQDILTARTRIRDFVRHTPLERSVELSRRLSGDVYLKMENLQLTGSFKPRGSFNRLQTLSESERLKGVIAPTAGNHGIGLSYAAAQLNIPAHIFLPENADPVKIALLKAQGAKIQFFETIEDARLAARRVAQEEGFTFVSAYNDKAVVAADGTIGLEILSDLPDVEIIVVCVGGGGLASGIGTVMKTVNSNIEVWGVQAANSPTFARWHEAGQTVAVELQPSIAEGLSGYIEPETITFPIFRQVVDRVVTVSEQELVDAMKWMLDHHQHVVEPSGAAAVAALLQNPEHLSGRKVAATITGRNISRSRLMALIG